MPTTTDLDCVTCGACCIADYDDDDYVHLTEDDLEQLTERDRRLLVVTPRDRGGSGEWIKFLALRTTHDRRGNCRCKALRGTIGLRVSCSIYERRPIACQRFKPASTVCLAAREASHIDGTD